MKLLRSTAFVRSARRLIKKNPEAARPLREALELAVSDPFHPRLKTHKLKGKLADSWALSVTYEVRIVFSFIEHDDAPAILLESVGTHDEVY